MKIVDVSITANKNNFFFFFHHHLENGLNFLKGNFDVNKIAKIMVGVGVQHSLTSANLLFNLKNPTPCTVN